VAGARQVAFGGGHGGTGPASPEATARQVRLRWWLGPERSAFGGGHGGGGPRSPVAWAGQVRRRQGNGDKFAAPTVHELVRPPIELPGRPPSQDHNHFCGRESAARRPNGHGPISTPRVGALISDQLRRSTVVPPGDLPIGAPDRCLIEFKSPTLTASCPSRWTRSG
jgi:hypothetical protein